MPGVDLKSVQGLVNGRPRTATDTKKPANRVRLRAYELQRISLDLLMVEVPGVEPGSENTPLTSLHV